MAKDILRKENFGIPLGQKFHGTSQSFGNLGRRVHTYDYTYVYEMVDSNPRLEYQRGDIIRFSKHGSLPKWKRSNFAVVIDRYRKTKFKGTVYRDYCTVLMMITGAKKGHTFRMSANNHGKLNKIVI